MTALNPRTSQAVTLALVVAFLLTAAASIRARGLYRTLLFILLGVGLPTLSEYHAINNMRLLRHHLQPQLKNVPLGISLAWYIAGYNTFTMLESLAAQYKLPKQSWPFLLPTATALTATSMDLVTDVALLDQGYWEWPEGGPYAPEVAGPNGKHGIPIDNYTGWLGLMGLVTFSYMLIAGDSRPAHIEPVKVGRQAAFLLLPSYLGAIAWELQQRRWRYILYSLLFPLVLLNASLGRQK
jgi:uncharacterized membrane protein